MSCVWLAEVCAEKDIMIGSKRGLSPLERYCDTVTDLAVPVCPTMSVCLPPLVSVPSSDV